MALRYDFDMVAVAPEGLPDRFGDLEATGIGAEKTAMFRDPQVVAALGRADAAVQQYFYASGFGMGTFDSGAPSGRFPAQDEAARADVIMKLTENVDMVDSDDLDWGGFNLGVFLAYLGNAVPIDESEMAAAAAQTAPVTPRSSQSDVTPQQRTAVPEQQPDIEVVDTKLDLDFGSPDLRRGMSSSKRKGIAMIGLALGVILLGLAALMALP